MMKECQYCHKEIPKSSRKCPECGKYCYKMYYADSPFKKRNKEIVRLLEAGNYTLNSVGEMFGISRERARQIYRKVRKTCFYRLTLVRVFSLPGQTMLLSGCWPLPTSMSS